MSPILVRPVREQLEHDRVIRLLQARYKRKFEVGINPGHEQSAPVGTGPAAWFPDLVLLSTERSHKLMGVVEVETAESVNNLEAMSQWVTFSKLRVPFHLYVPQSMIDPARRLCADLQVSAAEIWMYHMLGDQMRFTLVQRSPGDGKSRSVSAEARPTPRPEAKPRPAAPARARAGGTARPAPRAGGTARPAPRAKTTPKSPARPTRPARRAAPSASAARRKAPAAKSKAPRAAVRTKTSGSSKSHKRK